MIKKIIEIAHLLERALRRIGDSSIDEIEIRIKVPISDQAGHEPYYPKGSVTLYSIRYEKHPIYNPRVERFNWIGDVRDNFDLQDYITDCLINARRMVKDAEELERFKEGARVRVKGKTGDDKFFVCGMTGTIWSGQPPVLRVQLDDGTMMDFHFRHLELIK